VVQQVADDHVIDSAAGYAVSGSAAAADETRRRLWEGGRGYVGASGSMRSLPN